MKKISTTLMILLTTITSWAYDVCVDGIYYNLNKADCTAEVTSSGYHYAGTINIPETIISDGTKYKVTAIGGGAFAASPSSVSGVGSVIIPPTVTSIGGHAFYYCTCLMSIDIPSSVTSIGPGAFYNCYSLKSIEIPSSVSSIGAEAFYNCYGLTSVTIQSPLKSIENNVFCNCKGLQSINIPNTVKTIGSSAFGWCYSLTSITIPSSVDSIGAEAFASCNNLTSVKISDLNAWFNIDFEGEEANPLTSAHHLFLNDNEITELTIPSSVTRIKRSCFSGYTPLTSVSIPNTVTDIEYAAFKGCSGLTTLTLPTFLTSIGNSAFYGCSCLTSVIIPASVTTIGGSAFYDCQKLIQVYNYATKPQDTTHETFSNARGCILYVPKGCKSLYEDAYWWKSFKEIKEFEPSAIENISAENDFFNAHLFYSIDGKKNNTLHHGLNVIKSSEGAKKVFK